MTRFGWKDGHGKGKGMLGGGRRNKNTGPCLSGGPGFGLGGGRGGGKNRADSKKSPLLGKMKDLW